MYSERKHRILLHYKSRLQDLILQNNEAVKEHLTHPPRSVFGLFRGFRYEFFLQMLRRVRQNRFVEALADVTLMIDEEERKALYMLHQKRLGYSEEQGPQLMSYL